ncbi:phosphatase [Sarocladium implicatum]|nr:phosphatase [Sarocladium implicatum]
MEAGASTPDSPNTSEPVDLGSTPQSLARAVLARRSEYVRPQQIKVKIGTWNVAGCPGADKDLASWFVGGRGIDRSLATLNISGNSAIEHDKEKLRDADADSVRLIGGDDIGLYVLGLQEIVDLNMTKEYMNRAVYTDSGPVDKWKAALEAAMPTGYEMVACEQMSGLLLLVYASPAVALTLTNVSTKQTGTGLLGYFGNKGAVVTRLVLGETTRMVFVNSHLASGTSSKDLDRRCWDVSQILSKTQFEPVVHSGVAEDEGEKIGDEDFAFWFGDLNFRLDGLPGDDIRRLLTLHTRGEYGASESDSARPLEGEGVMVGRTSESDDSTTLSTTSGDQSFDTDNTLPDPDDFPEDPSQDPTSLQATLDSLLPHDQLQRMMKERKVFHDGWREGPVTFLPSYKYDVGTVGVFDTSEKRRAPSWCDRILYRTRKDRHEFERKLKEEADAKKRDEEMKARGVEQDEDVLFSYDPDEDGDDQGDAVEDSSAAPYDEYDEEEDQAAEEVITREDFGDHIDLDIYTSHQRITSSDHKPIISIFTIDYDAVVPELKAKVHAEVARELDRAENEGRPGVTIINEGAESQDQVIVDFGDVEFLDTKPCSLTIANTGSVAATFSFVDKPGLGESSDASPNWLFTSFVQPDGGTSDPIGGTVTLQPGETILVMVSACISAISQAQSLNAGKAHIDDVLVLRVEDGRDYFIPVHGRWLPTCFGRSIDELIRVPEGGIQKFAEKENISGTIPSSFPVQCSAPRELFKLTEALQTLAERCVADEAMLDDLTLPREPGWPFDAATWTCTLSQMEVLKVSLVTALDTDASLLEALPVELLSSHKIEVVASVLLLFLASLTDGLITSPLWTQVNESLPTLTALPQPLWGDTKTQILDILSQAPNHNIAFVFLASTLSRVASELTPVTADQRRSRTGIVSRRLSLRLHRHKDDDEAAKKRRAREKRYAEIVGPVACRAGDTERGAREKERVLLEICLQKDDGS